MVLLWLFAAMVGYSQILPFASKKLQSKKKENTKENILSGSIVTDTERDINNVWLHWDSGTNDDGIGTNDGSTFTAAARWQVGDLAAYNGDKITKVKVFIFEAGFSSIVLKIWTGDNGSNLIYQKQLTSINPGSWKETVLPTDIFVNSNQELWIGYTVFNPEIGKYPAGVDAGPAVDQKGNLIADADGNWFVLPDNLDVNWNIQFFVEGETSPVTADFSASQTNITAGQTVTFTNLSSGANEWTWAFEGGSPSVSSQQNPTVTYNTEGTYNVTLTAKNGAQQDVETKTNYITVGSSGSVTANFSASQTNITSGQTVTFTNLSSGANEWTWAFEGGSPSISSQQNPTVTYNNEGTFNVTLTAKNGAQQDVETKINYITVGSSGGPLSVEVTADPSTTICEFGSTTLTAVASGGTGGYQYTWTWDIDNQTITGNVLNITNLSQSTNVYLKVVSGSQEVNETIAITVEDNPPASVVGKGNPERILICPHPDLEYQWFQNNAIIDGATKQFYYPGSFNELSGIYYVLTTNTVGCKSYSENYTIGNNKTSDLENTGFMSVYPNPTVSGFNISINPELLLKEVDTYKVEIFSINGMKLWETEINPSINININPPTNLSNGLYIVKLKSGEEVFDTQKLVIN